MRFSILSTLFLLLCLFAPSASLAKPDGGMYEKVEYLAGPMVDKRRLMQNIRLHLKEAERARNLIMSNPPTVCREEERALRDTINREEELTLRLQRIARGIGERRRVRMRAEERFETASNAYRGAVRRVQRINSALRAVRAELRFSVSRNRRQQLRRTQRNLERTLPSARAERDAAKRRMDTRRAELNRARRAEREQVEQRDLQRSAVQEAGMIVNLARRRYTECRECGR